MQSLEFLIQKKWIGTKKFKQHKEIAKYNSRYLTINFGAKFYSSKVKS